MQRTTSPQAAVWAGLLFVNGPVAVLLFGAFAAGLGVGALMIAWTGEVIGLVSGVLAAAFVWCCAWAWWSWSVPRWRLWAYRRVEDVEALHARAVKAGLIWPEGHRFEKTEWANRQLRNDIITARRR